VIKAKEEGLTRAETIDRLSLIAGVYVPAFFEPAYNKDGLIKEIRPLKEGYTRVLKRTVMDLSALPEPTRPVVPYVEAIHDRFSIEIARGCTRGCRFCHAGMVTRPARERDPADVIRIIREGIKNTGYDEVSLLSLSTGDYCSIEPLLSTLMETFEADRVAVSLPSLRVGTLGEGLMEEIKRVKKTGFTLAPEAGTERLRDVINKGIDANDLIETARRVYGLGWRSIKLYFMIGLPTETKEDIDGILELSKAVRDTKPGGYYRGKKKGRGAQSNSPVSVSVGTFVPKPFTPFQWAPQISMDECIKKQRYLRDEVESAGMRLKWNDAKMSELEGVFSRGDRRLCSVVMRAFKKGARFDGWSDEFKYELWLEALEEEGLDKDFYTKRERSFDEVLPWDHLDVGVTKEFLIEEYKNALNGTECPDCKVDRCTDCGVCDHKVIKNIVFSGDSLEAKAKAKTEAGADESLPEEHSEVDRVRLRVNFSKSAPLNYLSHLEMKGSIFRALKRAELPVIYSGGFHPMPKVSFLDPTPVGMESDDEYMDIDLTGPLQESEFERDLRAKLPGGLDIKKTGQISLQLPSLSASIKGTKYVILIKNSPLSPEELGIEFDRLEAVLKAFREQDSIQIGVKRGEKSKVIDIKPFLATLLSTKDCSIELSFNNFAGPRVKPHEVLSKLLNISIDSALLIPIRKTGTVL
ncbi:MAG: TIGR03960 family B12-binding radical SAM protein, partial [Proteobacteria bacterium]|nr:TIGR03960 family B12-binding radical SAM protein [Pseudomonadota bacterium]